MLQKLEPHATTPVPTQDLWLADGSSVSLDLKLQHSLEHHVNSAHELSLASIAQLPCKALPKRHRVLDSLPCVPISIQTKSRSSLSADGMSTVPLM